MEHVLCLTTTAFTLLLWYFTGSALNFHTPRFYSAHYALWANVTWSPDFYLLTKHSSCIERDFLNIFCLIKSLNSIAWHILYTTNFYEFISIWRTLINKAKEMVPFITFPWFNFRSLFIWFLGITCSKENSFKYSHRKV